MSHTLPALPYAYNALAPYIGEETMTLHHTKHHQAYVDNLNRLVVGTEFEGKSLEEIVKTAPAGGIFNNAGQHWNHNQFWTMMAAPVLAVVLHRQVNSWMRSTKVLVHLMISKQNSKPQDWQPLVQVGHG